MSTSALAILATPAFSQVVDVTTTADTGAGSLRAAIATANSDPGATTVRGDIAGGGVITLSSGSVSITSNVTLDALGPLTISNIPQVPNQSALVVSGGNTLTIAAPVSVLTSFNEAPAPAPVVGGITLLGSGNRLDIYGEVAVSSGRQTAIHNIGDDSEIRLRSGGVINSSGAYVSAVRSFGANADITLDPGSELTARSFFGRGLAFAGARTTADVAGTITTTGQASTGIAAETGADHSIIKLSGRITSEYSGYTTGIGTTAEYVEVDIAASGEIATQGHELARGVSFTRGHGSVTVAGKILAGEGTAIEFAGTDNRLELHGGHSITGAVKGAGSDLLAFGGDTAASFDLARIGAQYTGFGSMEVAGTATWTLTGEAAGFAGPVALRSGGLAVNGTIAGAFSVESGATLGGTGTVGAVTVADGGTLAPGNSAGTLRVNSLLLNNSSILNFELGTPGVAADSDRIAVSGDLTLDGILNISDAGGFGNGVYTLINYGRLVADNGLALGTLPAEHTYSIDAGTGTASAVTLAVAGGAAGSNQYWDGAHTTAGGTLYGRGGAGVWNDAGTNWTDTAGTANHAWADRFGIFYNGTGNVTVEGAQTATGLQFASDGYRLVAGAGGALNLAGTTSAVRVDTGATATLALPLSVAGELTKQGAGVLALAGNSTIGTTLRASDGVLRIVDGAGVTATAAAAGTGGRIEVAGAGSSLALINATGSGLAVGIADTGSMSITDGATVSVDAKERAHIGDTAGGNGNLVISGADSALHLRNGGLGIGTAGGTGEVTVTDGGHLQVDGGYLVTQIPGGGPLGEDLTAFRPRNELIVGQDSGTAKLTVTNGGTVSAGIVLASWASDGTFGQPASRAEILVDGVGSTLSVNENLQLIRGGSITVSGGGALNTSADSHFATDPNRHIIVADRIYGEPGNISNVLVTGAGSTWHNKNRIRIEDRAALTVTDGALVAADNGLSIGFGRGKITTELASSLLVDNANLRIGTALDIATGGAIAKAIFRNGARIETKGAWIGSGSTCVPGPDGSCGSGISLLADADILVSGAGTTWIDGQSMTNFYTGDTGTTRLTVTDGAVIDTENRTIFGWGSYQPGRTDVVVSAGGRFSTARSMELGEAAKGIGTLTVEGAGSLVEVGETLEIGLSGRGEVSLRDQATIDVTAATHIATSAGGHGRLTVTGGGELSTSRVYMGITDGSASGELVIGQGSDSARLSAGQLDLRSGQLALGANGVLDLGTGPATIRERGVVTGTGTVKGDLVLAGRIAPGTGGIGTLTVDGHVTFGAGSVYAVDLQAPDLSDQIAISGVAVVDGGRLEITKLSADASYLDGQTYTIITASDVDVHEDFVLAQPFGLLRTDVVYGADRIDLTLTADVPFTTLAHTYNQTQAATGLQGLAQTGDALAAYNRIVGLSLQPGNGDVVRAAFDQASGEIHAAGRHVIDQSAGVFNRTLRVRGVSAGVLAATGDAPEVSRRGTDFSAPRARGAWVTPLGGFGDIDSNGNAGRLKWRNAGLTAGYEGVLDIGAGTAVAGLGVGYIRSNGTVDARLSTIKSNGVYIGAYGAWQNGPWALSGALTYGTNSVTTRRNIAFMGQTAEARYRTRTIGLSAEASYSFRLADATRIAPLFTLDAGRTRHGGFAETGAGALNLTSGPQSWGRFDAGIGVALTHSVPTVNGRMTFEGRAVWERAFADVVPMQDLALAGSPVGFSVQGPAASRNRLRIGAGLTWDVAENMTVRARYDGLFAGGQKNHTGYVGLNLRF